MDYTQVERWIREGRRIWDKRLKVQLNNSGLLSAIRARCAAEPEAFKLMGLEEEQCEALRKANAATFAATLFHKHVAEPVGEAAAPLG